jgi:hypothetical protein
VHVLGREADEFDLGPRGGGERPGMIERRDQRLDELAFAVGQEERHPIGALPGQVRRCEVAHIPQPPDRIVDRDDRLLPHARAFVQNPVDRGETDARFPRNIVDRRPPQ